ncbi:MAG: rubrerythrin family protein [Chloroflexota bacterium]|nr:rubrerythrin family protein [Chloroflexota bacterium]
MGEKTDRNLYASFVGEAKAYFRLLAYAEEAEGEGLPQIAALFRAVAEAERIHATRALRLLGEAVVKDTENNLRASFEREETASGVFYPRFIQEAEAEGEGQAVTSFSYARDVEEGHAALYRRALQHMLAETAPVYHVCLVCGYIAEGNAPDRCPICNAPRERFRHIT